MPKKTASQKRLEAVRHPLLVALKRIGPIWPSKEDLTDVTAGMRGVVRKKTSPAFDTEYRKARGKRNKVAKRSRIRNAA